MLKSAGKRPNLWVHICPYHGHGCLEILPSGTPTTNFNFSEPVQKWAFFKVQGSSSFSYQNFHFDPFWGIQISHFQPHPWCCSCAYLWHQLRRLRQLRRQYHSIEVPPVVAQAQLLGSDFSHWRAQMNGQAFLEGVKLQNCFLIHHWIIIRCHEKIQTRLMTIPKDWFLQLLTMAIRNHRQFMWSSQ